MVPVVQPAPQPAASSLPSPRPAAAPATSLAPRGLTPAHFTMYPWDSLLNRFEYERVAQNCMRIQKRTGNTWRQLTPVEYVAAREHDGAKAPEIEKELPFFRRVVMYTSAPENACEFSPTWANTFRLHARLYLYLLPTMPILPTISILALHATLPLRPADVDDLFAAVAAVEAGGSGTRLLEFFEAQLRVKGLPPLPADFCWELQGNDTLLIHQTAPQA